MRELFGLLQEFVARQDRRTQRYLLVSCTAAMALFAGTTVTAAQIGDYPNMMAGALLLAAVAVVSSLVWSARRAAARRR
jgi:hypothetical protein